MFDEIFLTFLECAKRGSWEQMRQDHPAAHEKIEPYMNGYRALANDAEVWIVRQDGVRRAFRFKPTGKVWIGSGMIKFWNSEMEEEMAVDENEKSGKPPTGKLDFSR
jgi:hypothetical protein